MYLTNKKVLSHQVSVNYYIHQPFSLRSTFPKAVMKPIIIFTVISASTKSILKTELTALISSLKGHIISNKMNINVPVLLCRYPYILFHHLN